MYYLDDYHKIKRNDRKETQMSKIVREKDREEAIREISEAVAGEILSMPIGSEAGISMLVTYLYGQQRYEWKRVNLQLGQVLTKDEGETYLIVEDEQFEILDRVDSLLRGKRYLDFSAYYGQIVGLPYNLFFTILEMHGNPIVSVHITEKRSFQSVEILITDSEEKNVRIDEVRAMEGFSAVDHVIIPSWYSVPYEDIEKIKTLCSDPILLDEREEEYEEDLIVIDGYSEDITLYTGFGEHYLEFSNLSAYKDHLDKAPQAKQAYKLISKVVSVASKASKRKKWNF